MKKTLFCSTFALIILTSPISFGASSSNYPGKVTQQQLTQPIILGYFANWDVYNKTLSTTPNKDFTFNSKQNLYKLARLNTVAYAFFEAAPDGTLHSFDSWSDFDSSNQAFCDANPKICFKNGKASLEGGYGNFNQFVNSGTTSGITNRLIAFGGAGHDEHVQAAMNNPDNFVSSLKILKSTYNFTGLDFDYEPVSGVPEAYKTKLINLMKKVREVMGNDFMITYTIIPNQSNIDAFGPGNWFEVEKTVNYINVMNYDIFGPWEKTTGLHSPLYLVPHTGGSGMFSADTAIERLKANGIPSGKIVLGYPSYGRAVSGVAGDGVGQPFTNHYRGNLDDQTCLSSNACSGMITYSKIIADNLPIQHQLQTGIINGAYSNFVAGDNGVANAFISFDDVASINAKVNYAKSHHLGGMMTWAINYDAPAVHADGSPNSASLLNAVNNAYGITPRPVTPPSTGPYFILQVSNISPDVAGGYASATLVINGKYYVFGNEWQKPISPGYHQSWSTAASAQPKVIIESDDLNNVFKNGAPSFTTSQILVNGYVNNDSIYNPNVTQAECKMGKAYTFKAGKAYNLMINAKPKEGWPNCDIKVMN